MLDLFTTLLKIGFKYPSVPGGTDLRLMVNNHPNFM